MPGQTGNKGGGRKGYNHERVVRLAYEIVEKELNNKGKSELTYKEKFNAALELVKKALPTNVKFDNELKLIFDGIFKTSQQASGDNKKQSKI